MVFSIIWRTILTQIEKRHKYSSLTALNWVIVPDPFHNRHFYMSFHMYLVLNNSKHTIYFASCLALCMLAQWHGLLRPLAGISI